MPNEELQELDDLGKVVTEHNVETLLRDKYSKIISGKHQTNPIKKKSSGIQSILKIASVVMVIFASIVVFRNNTNEISNMQMVQEYLDNTNVIGSAEITRNGSTAQTEIRKQVFEAHSNRDYTALASAYEKIQMAGELNNIDQYYLGVSYLKTANFKEAVNSLSPLSRKSHSFSEEVNWFLSLAYILTEQEDSSIELLEEIVNRKSYKYKEAQRLITTINNK